MLYVPEQALCMPAFAELECIMDETSSRVLRSVLSGFLTHYRDYRTYLVYPELYLPRTSNTAESLIGMIRSLCYRARGFRTIHALRAWIEALIKHRRTVRCNGVHQPN